MNEFKPLVAIGVFFWEIVKVIILAVIIIVPIRYFLVQPFFVRGASMEPNFFDGEYLVIDELSYRFREPRRGEVVVFQYPNNHTQFFIKRLIGLPGDTVLLEDGRVTIQNDTYQQGVVLDESPYLPEGVRTGGQQTVQLQAGEYYVLGDNRAASSDSRQWGILHDHEIVGRAWLRAWPLTRADWFEPTRPQFISVQEGAL
jgi:signal peptidase I